jgi:hypothetical protein
MADVPQIYQTKLQRAQKAYRGGNYPLSLELASSFSEDQVYRAQSGTTFDLSETARTTWPPLYEAAANRVVAADSLLALRRLFCCQSSSRRPAHV